MLIDNEIGAKAQQKLQCVCDNCEKPFLRRKESIIKSRKKWEGKDLCISCSCSLSVFKKPQCNKEYWTEEKCKEHGEVVKNSEIYQEGIKTRASVSGCENPMWGKKHSTATKAKMSKSRTGKRGSRATAWKGG